VKDFTYLVSESLRKQLLEAFGEDYASGFDIYEDLRDSYGWHEEDAKYRIASKFNEQ